MFCSNCGKQIDDNAQFCSFCGATTQPNTQNTYTQPTPASLGVNTQFSMKWYKFLIYFGLFAGAVVNLINGFMIVTGSHYEGYSDLVYEVFDGLQALDVIVGLALIALAAFGVYTRFRLSGFCSNGPQMLLYVYIGAAVINLIYIIGAFSILPEMVTESLDVSTYVASTVISIVMVFANKKYFDIRKELFVNK